MTHRYYPIMMDLKKRKVLVVGGGALAEHKTGELVKCGAKVTVLAPDIRESIRADKRIRKVLRRFKPKDVSGYFLVIGATSITKVNSAVAKAAKQNKILVNIVDVPRLCDYIMPSIIRSGKLTITVSTSGAAPFYSKWIADRMRRAFGEWWGNYLEIVEPARRKVIRLEKNPERRKIILAKMAGSKIMNLVRDKRIPEAKSALEEIVHER